MFLTRAKQVGILVTVWFRGKAMKREGGKDEVEEGRKAEID